MSQWLNEIIANGEQSLAESTSHIAQVRSQSLASLKQQGWPARRAEQWIFTPLTAFNKRSVRPVTETVANSDNVQVPRIDGVDTLDIIFIDGVLQTDVAAMTLPLGVTISASGSISGSLSDVASEQALASFAQIKPQRHLFGLVNDICASDILAIRIAQDTNADSLIRIVNIAASEHDAHTRVVVNVEAGASARIIEHNIGETDNVTTAFTEYQLAPSASLEHYRFVFHTDKSKHLGGCHFRLEEKSQLTSNIVAYGSDLSRLDVDIHHAGEFADVTMNCIYLLAEGELFDLHSNIEHMVPHCTSEENARGIVGDKAKAVFNGRIHIHRDAQKTLAEMNNRNLLLSRRGVINTKPELEIYADDVKCAHGATVAEIEEKALYYLLSRGISRSRALVMLNFGFIQELVNRIPEQAIIDWLLPKLSERFAHMEVK